MLEDGKVLKQFTNEHRNAAQRIRDALEDRILQIENGALADGTELYRNTAGEIEARDTAARRDLTSEERRAYKPDLGDENTVFTGDTSASYSVEMVDGRLMPVIDIVPNTSDYGAAESYLKTLIDAESPFSTILSDAHPVYIGKDLPGEYRSSKYTKRMKSTLRKAKMQAATNLDEMLLLAENGEWQKNEKAKHRIDAKNGWYRYTTEFAVPVMDAKKP